jgi:hypothetical protein
MKRIIVYGNSDKRPGLGFPKSENFVRYIKEEIFNVYKGRYHYSQNKIADIILLARNGKAYGYFEISDIQDPTNDDIKVYDRCKKTYIVKESVIFEKPVQLSELEITGYQFGKSISEQKFNEIKNLAGKKSIYTN